MNPCEIERATAAYLKTVANLPAGTQVLEAVNVDTMDLEKQAVIAQAANMEFRSPTCFVATVEVSIRTPATAFTQTQHSDLVALIGKALANNSGYTTGFNTASSTVDMLGAAPPNFRAPTYEDRAWINVIAVDCGVVDAA